MVVTKQQLLVVIVQVHPAALAIFPQITVGTLPFLCPATITVLLKAVLPHIPQVVLVDIALMKITSY